jgi:hypothetical protein
MQLPLGLGKLDFAQWGYGLLAAFIGGGAGAFSGGLASIIVDPQDFNIFTQKFWALVLTTFFISGLTPFFAYLHQQPLPPELKTVERTTQTTIPATSESPKVVETIKETHVEQMTNIPTQGSKGSE